MQIFLPYSDCFKTAECLDDKRLNKQRSDIVQVLKQIVATANDPEKQKKHSLVVAWKGNEGFLIKNYAFAICMEYAARGNVEATYARIREYLNEPALEESSDDPPEWFGNEALHDAHKSYLLRLEPSYYRQYWPDLSDDLQMINPRMAPKQRVNRQKRESQRLLNRARRSYEKALEAIGDAARLLLDTGLPWPVEEIPVLPSVDDLFGTKPLDDLDKDEPTETPSMEQLAAEMPEMEN